MEVISAFGCSFCGMASRHKSSVARHEVVTCKKNPSRKSCLTCIHWFDNGVDDNGMDGPYKHEWLDAGCGSENIELDEYDTNELYCNRNSNNQCQFYVGASK